MDTVRIAVYESRARQLAAARDLCRDDLRSYAAAVALLAVHSAISFNDAVLITLTGQRPLGDSHRESVDAITKACRKAKINGAGIRHLRKLVSRKTDISYGDKQVDDQTAAALCEASRRFQAWAEPFLGDNRTNVWR